MEIQTLHSTAEQVAKETHVNAEVLAHLIGHNWSRPCAQIPNRCITLGSHPQIRRTSATETLCGLGLAYVTSKLGKHRGPLAINPASGRQLSSFTFMTEKACDEYGQSLYLVHTRCIEDEYKLEEAEFREQLREEVQKRLAQFSGFLGDYITLQGKTGMLLRETPTSVWITSPNGLPLKIKKAG